MLKYFYKSFLIAVISGSLLTLQSSAVFAEVKTTSNTTTTGKDGTITNNKTYQLEKISDADLLTSITMIAGGLITGRMLVSYRPITMDVGIAGAGGAAFVAGEFMTNSKFKAKMDDLMVQVEKKNDGKINEEQIQRIQDLRDSYADAKSTTEKKKTLQKAAATAFGIAALTATYMAIKEKAAIATCATTMQGAKATLKACAGSSIIAPSESASCMACLPLIVAYEAGFNEFHISREKPGSLSIAKQAAADVKTTFLTNPVAQCSGMPGAAVSGVAASMASACTPGVIMSKMWQTSSANLKGVVVDNGADPINNILKHSLVADALEKSINQQQGLVSKIIEFFLPTANAGMVQLLGFSAATLGAIFLISGTTAVQLDTLMFVPSNRAIAFGLLSALALMASKSSENVIGKIDKNIEKLDVILADLNKLALGVKAQNIDLQKVKMNLVRPGSGNTEFFSPDGSLRTPCMTSSSTSKCPSLATQLSSMPGFSGLPDSFKDIASQSGKLADGLSGANGISGATMATAEGLAGKQAIVGKMLKQNLAGLDKVGGEKGYAEKAQDKLLAGLNAGVKRDLQKKGMTASGFMSSIGSSAIDSSLKVKEEKIEKKSIAAIPSIDIGTGAAADSMSLDFKDSEAAGETGAEAGAVASQPTQEYDIKDNDINGQNGPSLFELISGRYIKSGYPKLLEEEPTKN